MVLGKMTQAMLNLIISSSTISEELIDPYIDGEILLCPKPKLSYIWP
jgi:hypothetical protein